MDLVPSRSTGSFINNVCTTFYLPSDHATITCALHIARPEPVKMKITLRKLRDIDLDSFRSDILNSPLFSSPINDIDLLVDEYNNVLTDLRDHAPLIRHTVRCRPNAPWYNDELRDMKRESRRLERRWISSKLEIQKQLFKERCKKYNLAIKHVKQFDKLCAPTTSKSLPSDTSDDELVNRFSHFFSDKIQRIKQNLIHSDEMDFSRFYSDQCDSSFSDFSLISEETVRDIIMKSPSSTCSLDPIPTKFCQ